MDAPRPTLQLRTALAPVLGAALCGGLLAGCVETTASLPPPAPEPHHAMARREGVSLGGASIAVASLTGVPQPLADRFVAALKQAAQAQDVSFTEPAKAKYLLRGYLSAYPTEAGAEDVAFVWDAFDARKHRAQRGSDSVSIKATGDDPWAAVDDATLAAIATQSASDIAAFLSNTPEALVASRTTPPRVRTAAADPSPAATETVVPGTPATPEPPPLRGTAGVGVAALR